jgi:hypothetical protein
MDWNGHIIEIQLRTQLQHSFATAVETVTTFTKQALKFGGGQQLWRRFFSVVSAAFAMREGSTPVSATPRNEQDLKSELKDLCNQLKVEDKLRAWAKAMNIVITKGKEFEEAKWLLLRLDLSANQISVTPFINRAAASLKMESIESERAPGIDAVLVWVNHCKSLHKAYPNYFADTAAFLTALNAAIKGEKVP